MADSVKNIVGLKFKCTQCGRVFKSPQARQAIFDMKIAICDGCSTIQSLSPEKKQYLIALGNPGKIFCQLLCVPGLTLLGTGAAFFAGYASDAVVMTGFTVAFISQLVIGAGSRKAIKPLNIALNKKAEAMPAKDKPVLEIQPSAP